MNGQPTYAEVCAEVYPTADAVIAEVYGKPPAAPLPSYPRRRPRRKHRTIARMKHLSPVDLMLARILGGVPKPKAKVTV